ncbi:protein Skeletor, isoforms B/C [Neodiprion virginianus]|uniref:protein Skeletor, isoforms B/C n=1 Tax=Neodiprion virginianus TaxID=2961670 RepID=UPI001EE75EA1|nr:protein Skeletor, isoforms B/C [Neodiprion virginianus]
MEATGLRVTSALIFCVFFIPDLGHAKYGPNYYGRLIGPLQEYAHQTRGTVYAVDDTTIFIKDFSYDGTGPAAYFWVGNSPRPSPDGFIVPYPEDYSERDPPVLKAYNNSDIILRLPQGNRIRDIKWLSVWCQRFTVDFGDVFIPRDLDVPKPRVLPEFSRFAHGLRSGNISILDSKTLYIPNLHYDGEGPDAYFWVGNDTEPNPLGVKVPNEMGSLDPLRGYQGEDIEIVLPDNLTVYDIEWLSVWCVQYRHNFGHVYIPKDLDVPPALGQTKITPPWWYNPTSSTRAPPKSILTNCREMLNDRIQVQWEMVGENVEIRVTARIREDQYVAFGLSGMQGKAQMIGGDVAVVWYDEKTKEFHADDYYMSDLAQCDGIKGVCPDERIHGKNDVVLLHGERKNDLTSVKYMRPVSTNELVMDQMIPDTEVSVIAAIGRLNSRGEANAHESFDRTTEDMQIDFTSKNDHQCKFSLYQIPGPSKLTPWPPAKISGETTFSARIGPTGGLRGYSAITGQPSWGIAWYINDLLIPEIYVERGQTYTFTVEGGSDPNNPARYHPFYITDNPEGGFGQRNSADQKKQKVYAGVAWNRDDEPYPTAAGRYCEWIHKTIDMSEDSETFESFADTLRLECQEGEPAVLTWTVPEDAPDLLYYQCYSHNNLGWKIRVVDPGFKLQKNGNPAVMLTSLRAAIIMVTSILSFLR